MQMLPSPSGVISFSSKHLLVDRQGNMLPSPSGVISFSSCLCNSSIHAVSFATLRLKNSTTLFFEAIFLFSRKITFRAGTFFHILVMTMLPNDTLTVRCSDNLGNRFSSFSVKDSLYYRFITNQKKRNNTLFIILTTHCRFVCKNSRTYFRHSRRDTGGSWVLPT